MKIIFDLDNDKLIGITALMDAKRKKQLQKYIANHKEVSIDNILFSGEVPQDVEIAFYSIALIQISANIEKENK